MKEWEFDVESENVDLDRLRKEVMSIPCAIAVCYINELVKKAPEVYKRYRNKDKAEKDAKYKWDFDWDYLDEKLEVK